MVKTKTRKPRHRLMKKAHPIRWRFRRWLVPNRRNNFRPKFIDRYSLAALALLFVAVQLVSPLTGGSSVLGQQTLINKADLLSSTNEERQKAGASPLKINQNLATAAQMKAKDMLEYGYWSHTSPGGITPWHWLDEADYSYAYAGENLARNFGSASAVVAAWMASPGHRDNMLHKYYTEVGFATVDGQMNGRPVSLVVAFYSTPASSLTEVAGMKTQAPKQTQLGFLARIGVAVQSMSAPMLGFMVLLTISLTVAAITAALMIGNRRHIQGGLWRRYHATIKVAGMSLFVIMIILVQSSGQIG